MEEVKIHLAHSPVLGQLSLPSPLLAVKSRRFSPARYIYLLLLLTATFSLLHYIPQNEILVERSVSAEQLGRNIELDQVGAWFWRTQTHMRDFGEVLTQEREVDGQGNDLRHSLGVEIPFPDKEQDLIALMEAYVPLARCVIDH